MTTASSPASRTTPLPERVSAPHTSPMLNTNQASITKLHNKVGSLADTVSKTEPSSTPPLSSRLKRWFSLDEELASGQVDTEASQQDVQLSQKPASSNESTSSKPDSQTTALGSAAAKESEGSMGSRMPDFMNDLVGEMPLGAVVASSGLLVYGVTQSSHPAAAVSSPAPAAHDTRPPELKNAVTSADGKTIILTYDETLSSSVTPSAGAFSVTSDGTAVSVSAVARGADGKTIVLTLTSAITGFKTALVSYTAPAAPTDGSLDLTLSTRDLSGNHAASFTAQTVKVIDTAAPTVVSSSAFTSADTSTVVITYSETLHTTALPLPGAFTVTLDGTLNPVSAVSIVGTELRLTLQKK